MFMRNYFFRKNGIDPVSVLYQPTIFKIPFFRKNNFSKKIQQNKWDTIEEIQKKKKKKKK